MNKVNVCIFGAGGQLGSKLVESFVKNDLFNIYAIDKTFKKKISHENLKYFSLDIQNPLENELKKIPRENIVFINCIGLQHAFLSRNITKVNFHLNKKLYDFIDKNYTNYKFIFISSLSVDNTKPSEILPGVGKPINLYGESKLMFEKYLFQRLNENVTVIRPAAFYDLKLSKNLENFFNLLINKIFFLPSKNVYRSFLSLEYFCKFLEEFVIKNYSTKIFEIADNEPIEFNTLIKHLKNSKIEVNSKIIYLPKFLFKTAGFMGYFFEKLGIHISLLTILGEFGYDFVADDRKNQIQLEKEDTYENFKEIIKKFNWE